MGSSKKHKEKRDKKKHKKRSCSRERDHKKAHKSSHRKDKQKSPDIADFEEQDGKSQFDPSEMSDVLREPHNIDSRDSDSSRKRNVNLEDEFDVDKLLDEKLTENKEITSPSIRASKKRRREAAIEELRKRSKLDTNEDSLEKFAQEQLLEEHSSEEGRKSRPSSDIPFLGSAVVKEELESDDEDYSDRQSLSMREANKGRSKLGQKPLDVGKEKSVSLNKLEKKASMLRAKLGFKPKDTVAQKAYDEEDVLEANKLRAKLGLIKSEEANHSSASLDPDIIEANRLRAQLGLKPLDTSEDIPERSEPQLSLSISDTNKLRAKLGLKPLEVGNDIPGLEDGDKEISKPAAEIFVKTENISEKKKSEALREKLKVTKEKRKIESKLRNTKGIADTDSEDESAASWVIKHQKLLQEKKAAEKRAKLLEEMDKEFGVGALVEEEFDKKEVYSAQNLKGLTIGHSITSFQEGRDVILTLKDKGVLEEEDDVLENVNIIDSEKYAKNVENKKKKPDYRPYEEPEFDEFGILKKKNLLSKYDEEIEGEKKKSFKIGTMNNSSFVSKEQELELIRMKLKQQNEMSLEMPDMKIANEYYTPEDMVQFRKPKKKKKIRRNILKADDLLGNTMEEAERDFGSRRNRRQREMDFDAIPSEEHSSTGIPLIEKEDETISDLSKVVIDEESAEKELSDALHKARKLKERKIMATAPEKVIEILSSVDGSGKLSQKDKSGNIEMNSVAEFCRTLGEIPTYGLSGNRDEEAEDLMDLEQELLEERSKEIDPQNQGAWNEVDVDEKPAEILVR
nr:U4/U6.U5 tri-snRNP-associated protein 1 isoform X2 [Parasteatoda tepidariorum]